MDFFYAYPGSGKDPSFVVRPAGSLFGKECG